MLVVKNIYLGQYGTSNHLFMAVLKDIYYHGFMIESVIEFTCEFTISLCGRMLLGRRVEGVMSTKATSARITTKWWRGVVGRQAGSGRLSNGGIMVTSVLGQAGAPAPATGGRWRRYRRNNNNVVIIKVKGFCLSVKFWYLQPQQANAKRVTHFS